MTGLRVLKSKFEESRILNLSDLQISDLRSQISKVRSQISDFRFQTSDFRISEISDFFRFKYSRSKSI
jgi:hypothetical protein